MVDEQRRAAAGRGRRGNRLRGSARRTQRGRDAFGGVVDGVGAIGDDERRIIGVMAAGQHHRADAGPAARDDIAVLRVADVPAALRNRAAGLGRQLDDARVRLAQADLVGIALHGEPPLEPVLGEHLAVAAARVGVRDDADRDAALVGEIEQFGDAGTQRVRRDEAREIAQQVARFRDEQPPGRLGHVAREEVSDDLAGRKLRGGQPAALRVLPVLQRDEARAERRLDLLGRHTGIGTVEAHGRPLGHGAHAAGVLRGLEDHPAEVEQNRVWNVPDRCRMFHAENATSAR